MTNQSSTSDRPTRAEQIAELATARNADTCLMNDGAGCRFLALVESPDGRVIYDYEDADLRDANEATHGWNLGRWDWDDAYGVYVSVPYTSGGKS